MSINSRSKGSKNERELSKIIETWTGKNFSRTPSSGGLQWKNSMSKGDIVCTSEGHYFPFCIEAKNYREIEFNHLLYPSKKGVKILEFWKQCIRDANLCNKCPILFMRYNGMPKNFHFVMVEDKFLESVSKYLQSDDKMFRLPWLELTIITTECLLKIPYKKIRKQIKKLYKPE